MNPPTLLARELWVKVLGLASRRGHRRRKWRNYFPGDTVSVVDDRFDDREVRGISAGFLDGRMVD